MAEKAVLRIAFRLLCFPLVFFSWFAERVNLWKVQSDLERCLRTVDETVDEPVPGLFVSALVVAEDRRYALHVGVDPIAITRALVVRLSKGPIQGASTIEQQFVRVVCNRHERSLHRKLWEQLLAIALSKRRPKYEIASAYLTIAYYGFGLTGRLGLRELCGENLESCAQRKAHEAIARLKYPEPRLPTERWRECVRRRVGYISLGLALGQGQEVATADIACMGDKRFHPLDLSGRRGGALSTFQW